MPQSLLILFVDDSDNFVDHITLWHDLLCLSRGIHLPWMIIGDFNVVHSPLEIKAVDFKKFRIQHRRLYNKEIHIL